MPEAGASPSSRERVLELAFELTSVVPLGGFALLHLATYGRTLFGAGEIGRRTPLSGWTVAAEALGIWVPLAFHAVYSCFVWQRRRREPAPEQERAWVALQRVTGVVLALFLVDHGVRFRLPILRGDRYPAESVNALARELSTTVAGFPVFAGVHALGALALSFHLGYGLLRITERRARPGVRRRLRAACAVIGVTSALVGTLTVVHLAAG